MVWIRAVVVAVAIIALFSWMSAALAAVFAKLDLRQRDVWVPIYRHVVVSRAAHLPTGPVWGFRSVAAAGWLVFALLVLLRAADAVAGSSGVGTTAGVSFAIAILCSAVGWLLWVVSASRIELRLAVERRLWWLAALLPPMWATVVGFGKASAIVSGPIAGTSVAPAEPAEADDATRAIRHVAAVTAAPTVPPNSTEPESQPKLSTELDPASGPTETITEAPPLPREETMTTEEHDLTGEVPRKYSPYDLNPVSLTPVPMPDPPSPWGHDDDDDATFFAQRRRARWVLRVVGAEEYDLEDITTIGREGIRPIPGVLPIIDDTRTMSKLHARLRREADHWFVTDLGSTNGTFVRDPSGNEFEVKAQTEAKIEGMLLLGDLEALIVDQREAVS